MKIQTYIYLHTYYITLHCITLRYNTIQWQYIYSPFTVQYITLHNVTLHTYIPAKVHQIARTEVMVRNFQGQKSGLIFIKVELSYTYLYNSKDKVLVLDYIKMLFLFFSSKEALPVLPIRERSSGNLDSHSNALSK